MVEYVPDAITQKAFDRARASLVSDMDERRVGLLMTVYAQQRNGDYQAMRLDTLQDDDVGYYPDLADILKGEPTDFMRERWQKTLVSIAHDKQKYWKSDIERLKPIIEDEVRRLKNDAEEKIEEAKGEIRQARRNLVRGFFVDTFYSATSGFKDRAPKRGAEIDAENKLAHWQEKLEGIKLSEEPTRKSYHRRAAEENARADQELSEDLGYVAEELGHVERAFGVLTMRRRGDLSADKFQEDYAKLDMRWKSVLDQAMEELDAGLSAKPRPDTGPTQG